MSIMCRHILKNIFAKPFRTILLLLCITSFVFTGMLCLDMSGSLGRIVKNMLSQATGTSDITVSDPFGLKDEVFEISEPVQYVRIASKSSGTIQIPKGFYSYFHTDPFEVMTMDYAAAGGMKLISEELFLTEDEAAVSVKLAENLSLEVGDVLELYSDAGEKVEYSVAKIMPDFGVTNGQAVVLLSEEGFLRLDYDGVIDYTMAYVDAMDDSKANVAADQIRALDYRADVAVIIDGEELKALSKMITMMFLLMFSICFLLVIFVTISVSRRIVSERMPVVGTFRSLGLSNRFTTIFLLAESVFYGLVGGICGCVLYGIVRGFIYSGIVQVDSGSMNISLDYGTVSIFSYLLVILLAVLVECACSIREVIAAAKTSIRDIIFDNKDTKYRENKTSYVIGAVLLLTAILLTIFSKSVAAMLVAFAAYILALSLLFPILLKTSSRIFARFFEKREKPVLMLASMETFARKSTVGSTSLCVTTAALVIVLIIFAESLSSIYDIHSYDCDLHVITNRDQKVAMFSYIDGLPGVTETELVYVVNRDVTVGALEEDINVVGMPEEGLRMYTGIKNLPDLVEEGSFYMDQALAEKAGVQVGDQVSIIFDADSFLPTTKEMRLAGYIDSYELDTTSKTILISKDLYVDIFHDYPGEILIRCEDPEQTKAQIEKYSGMLIYMVESNEEYIAGWMEKKDNLRGLIMFVILLGVLLTVIGMVSNQLIGFDGRRRECAVLLSTAMNVQELSKMFIVESMLAAGTALVSALPVALLGFIPFQRVMEDSAGSMRISYNILLYVGFLGLLFVVFTLVSIFPVVKLYKMKIASQLKYE